MRDRIPDAKVHKNTLAVILGEKASKTYHYALIIGGFLAILVYFLLTGDWLWACLSLLVVIPIGMHLVKVASNKIPAVLDPELKKVALSTFLFSILFALGYWL
jgi:1,4-dihydroxy-2-naphthoate octaprenyltransferase